MRIDDPSELQSELKTLLAYTRKDRPSRTRIARSLADLATRVAAAWGEATGPSVDTVMRHGEFNLFILHDRPSRWSYRLENPHGGSFSTGGFPSAKRAMGAALSRGITDAPEKIWCIIGEWSYPQDGYVAVKKFWVDVPPAGGGSIEKWDLLTR